MGWFILIVILLILVYGVFTSINNEKEKEHEMVKQKKRNDDLLSIYKTKISAIMNKDQIQNSIDIVTIVSIPSDNRFKRSKYYFWKDKETINFLQMLSENDFISFSDLNELEKISLKLADIDYYSVRRSTTTDIKSSGGTITGGGSSISGAIIGGIVGGGVGAIIGSREKIKSEPLKIETVHNSSTELYMNYCGIDLIKKSIFFDINDLSTLRRVIPEKDYNYKK